MKPDFQLLVERLWGVAYVAEPGERGHWLYVSPRIKELLGFSREEWQANPELWVTQIHPEDRDRVLRDEQETTSAGGLTKIEYRLRRKSGEFIWVSDEALVSSSGDRVIWYGVLSDVTDRKRAQEAVAESEDRYRSLVQNAPDGISVVSPTGDVIYSSPAKERLLGRAAGGCNGDSAFANIHPDDMPKAHAAFQTLVEKPGLVLPILLRARHANGDWRWLEINATSMVDSPAVGGIVVNFRDVTERKRLEDELRQSRARFEAQYRGIPVPTYTWKRHEDDFVLVDCNIAAQDITGGLVNESFGTKASEMYSDRPDIVSDFRACAETQESIRRDFEYTMHSTGECRFLSVTYAFVPPDLVMVHTLDITEQKRGEAEQRRLEEQLRHAQKMEAIGRIAGGVAHDFNNLLAVILNYTEFLKEDLPRDDPRFADLREISLAARRGARLVQKLLAFSRKQVVSPEALDLNEVIFSMEQLLRNAVGRDIALVIKPGVDLWSIRIDLGQIEQTLLNLAVNAKDAMPHGGRLLIETVNLTVPSSSVVNELQSGDYVRLRVQDSGTGMADEIKAQIFDPFFTTKPLGAGTGLGLAMVYGAVKQARGHVVVDSVVDEGTTFEFFFPAVHEQSRPRESHVASPSSPGSGRRILVVDDEEPLRKLISRVLTRAGYEVSVAISGAEALALLDQPDSAYDLMVSDVVMPYASGLQLAEHARRAGTRPPRVLFMSGHSEDLPHWPEETMGSDVGFLAKPFSPEELLQAVAERLE